jgi:hypothetical protein
MRKHLRSCRKSFPLHVERLEERDCPTLAFNVILDAQGNLDIIGTPLDANDNFMLLSSPAPGEFQFQAFTDASKTTTYFDSGPLDVAGRIRVFLPNTDDTLCLDLQGNAMPADFYVDAGFGNDFVLQNTPAPTPGEISGNVLLNRVNHFGIVTDYTFFGNVTMFTDGNPDPAGQNDLSISNSTIQGTLRWNAGLPAAFLSNNFTLSAVEVEGNVLLNLKGITTTSNLVTITGGTNINGLVSYTGSTGIDNIALDNMVIGSSASFRLGNNTNQFQFQADAIILGNLIIVGGNQQDDINTFEGTVGGYVSMILYNGPNNVNITGANILGNRVAILTGSGADTVVFDGNAAGAFLDVRLGSGNDTFTLGASTALSAGRVDGGFGQDTFIGLITIDFPFALISIS